MHCLLLLNKLLRLCDDSIALAMETDFYLARRIELVLNLNSQLGTHVFKWKEMESEGATGIGWKKFELAHASSPEAWDTRKT